MRPIYVAVFLLLTATGCSCQDKPAGSPADASPAPDAAAQDQGTRDSSAPPDTPSSPDIVPSWNKDLGPDPDINLTLCVDACAPEGAADTAPPLTGTPGIKWKTLLGKGYLMPGSPMLGPDGTIYITTGAGVQAVDPEGKLMWTVPPYTGQEGVFNGYQQVTSVGNLLVLGSGAGFHGVFMSGQPSWTVSLQGPFDPLANGVIAGAPAVASTAEVVIPATDHMLYRLSASGSVLSKRLVPGGTWGPYSPVVDVEGNIYLGSQAAARVVSFAPDGKLRWLRSVTAVEPYITAYPVPNLAFLPSGDVVVAAVHSTKKPPQGGPPTPTVYKTFLAAMDPGCGAERWRVTVAGSVRFPLIVGPEGRIFVGVHNEAVGPNRIETYTSSGQPLWSTPLENSGPGGYLVLSGIGPIGADGVLYALIVNGYPTGDPTPSQLRAYSTATGKELWKLPIPGMTNPDLSQPVLRSDGTLIFGTEIDEGGVTDTYLLAVVTTSPGLVISAWPRGRHDNLNSSNASTKLP